MFEEPFVFVDIETNGGSGPRGRVIEVAAIKVIEGEIVDTFQSLVNPGGDVPYWITTLTGIENHELADAPYFPDIARSLYEFMDGCVFVAHNVLFDYSFLKREFTEVSLRFVPQLFCTVKMSRALFPEHRGHSLEKIINRHGLVVASRHRAYDDALAMYQYVQVAIAEKGVDALRANIALQSKTKSLPPHVDEKTIVALPDTPGVYIFEDDTGAPLYVGKSVNIRSRVRSHFTNATTIAKEMRLSLQSHNISYIQTETELEALLLESAKVKELQPVFNRKLRRTTTQHLLVRHMNEDGYLTFLIESHDLSSYADLKGVYGVFTSRTQAKATLDSLGRTYQLCPKLLGLENTKGACFRHQLGLCKGACIGLELPESYNKRIEFAFERTKIESWPYTSKIAVPLTPTRALVVDQWIPQGIYDNESNSFSELPHSFDMDAYKLMRAYMKKNQAHIVLVDDSIFEQFS